MNKQEFIKQIADTLKVDAEILATELNKESEISLEIPKLQSFTDDELSTRDNGIKKTGYEEGKKAGSDMTAKKLKEVTGIEVEGKDINSIANAIVSKTLEDAKIEPNKKISELQQSISKLQETVTTKESELEQIQNNFKSYKTEAQILAEIPTNSVGLSNKTVLAEMKANGFDFTDEGVTKNGELIKDERLQKPLTRTEVFTGFLTEKEWLKSDNKTGRGLSDEGGSSSYSTIKSIDDYKEYCKEEGIKPLSEEGKAVLIEARKTNNF